MKKDDFNTIISNEKNGKLARLSYKLISYNKEKTIGLFAYQLSFIHPVKKEKMTFRYMPIDRPFNMFDLRNIDV